MSIPQISIPDITKTVQAEQKIKTFKIDPLTGQFVTVDGKLVPVGDDAGSDKEAVKSYIYHVLKTWKGVNKTHIRDDVDRTNWFGIDYEEYFYKMLPLTFIQQEMLREITDNLNKHPNISDFRNVEVLKERRIVTIKGDVVTDFGVIPINETLEV